MVGSVKCDWYQEVGVRRHCHPVVVQLVRVVTFWVTFWDILKTNEQKSDREGMNKNNVHLRSSKHANNKCGLTINLLLLILNLLWDMSKVEICSMKFCCMIFRNCFGLFWWRHISVSFIYKYLPVTNCDLLLDTINNTFLLLDFPEEIWTGFFQ